MACGGARGISDHGWKDELTTKCRTAHVDVVAYDGALYACGGKRDKNTK